MRNLRVLWKKLTLNNTVKVYTLGKVLNALKTTYTNDPTLYIVLRWDQYYTSKQEWHYYLFIHLLVVYW